MSKDPQLCAIGQQIRKIREECGFSQEGFAIEVGLDRAYYGGVERGERNVAALNLVKIAIKLGVEVGVILHPSPASPAANRNWARTATKQLQLRTSAATWCFPVRLTGSTS